MSPHLLRLNSLTAALLLAVVVPFFPVPLVQFPATAQTSENRSPTRETPSKELADQLLQQGVQQLQTSQYPAAIKSWQQALDLYHQVGDRNGEGLALMNLGVAYLSQSQYGKASEYFQKALPILQAVGDRNGEAKALVNLGLAYLYQSQYGKASEYF